MNAARQTFAAGQFDDAVKRFDALRQQTKSLPPGRIVMAWMFMSLRRGPAALATLERAAVETPLNPCVYSSLGQLAMGQGRLTDARLQFQHAITLASPVGFSAKQKTGLQNSVFDGLVQVAEKRAQWGDVESLLGRWQKATGDRPQLQARLARARFFLGDEEGAEQLLRIATTADASLDPSEILLASFHRQLGQFDATHRLAEGGRGRTSERPTHTKVTRRLAADNERR